MDMKLKIIILVFIIIALLYAVYFIVNQLNENSKKKETFIIDDDVEHYEDPVVKTPPEKKTVKTEAESDKYDTRVLILNDIEKMDITDKEIKGKWMEYLFTSDVINKISSMANTERSIFIRSKYDLLKTGQNLTSSETTEKKEKAEFSSSQTSEPAPVVPPPSKKISSSVYDGLSNTNRDLLTKTEEALEYIQKVQTNIQQMQENIKSKAVYIDKLPEGYREPELPVPKVVEGFQDGPISGFENVKNYASLF